LNLESTLININTTKWETQEIQNQWKNYIHPTYKFSTIGYFKDSLNIVHLKGIIIKNNITIPNTSSGVNISDLIFVLPITYRPKDYLFYESSIFGGHMFKVEIYSNGEIVLVMNVKNKNYPNDMYNGTSYASLNNIHFIAEL
jgi:hypothetical protein